MKSLSDFLKQFEHEDVSTQRLADAVLDGEVAEHECAAFSTGLAIHRLARAVEQIDSTVHATARYFVTADKGGDTENAKRELADLPELPSCSACKSFILPGHAMIGGAHAQCYAAQMKPGDRIDQSAVHFYRPSRFTSVAQRAAARHPLQHRSDVPVNEDANPRGHVSHHFSVTTWPYCKKCDVTAFSTVAQLECKPVSQVDRLNRVVELHRQQLALIGLEAIGNAGAEKLPEHPFFTQAYADVRALRLKCEGYETPKPRKTCDHIDCPLPGCGEDPPAPSYVEADAHKMARLELVHATITHWLKKKRETNEAILIGDLLKFLEEVPLAQEHPRVVDLEAVLRSVRDDVAAFVANPPLSSDVAAETMREVVDGIDKVLPPLPDPVSAAEINPDDIPF